MSDAKSVLDCKTCGEAGFNWTHGDFSGVACRAGPHVEVLKMPAWLKVGAFLKNHEDGLTVISVISVVLLLCGLIITAIVFFGGEGPADFCYLKGRWPQSTDNKSACLYAHVEWKGDRFLGCWPTNQEAMYERDTVLKCPSEFLSK